MFLVFSLSAVQWLLLLVLCCPSPLFTNLSPVLAQAPSCPPNTLAVAADFAGTRVEGHGALEPLLSSAKSTREVILSDQLPYGVIRDEIRKRLSSLGVNMSRGTIYCIEPNFV